MAVLARRVGTLHFVVMIRRLTPFACFIACAALSTGAYADLRGDVTRCAKIADGSERLACFDALAVAVPGDTASGVTDGERAEMLAALRREFRFSPELRTGDFSFRLTVSGELKISRDTAVARDVERLVRRIDKTFDGISGWGVTATVHGGSVTLSRGTPYTGDELAAQTRIGLERVGLPADRFAVEIGKPAQPRLWDDGRIRDANEHVDIVITGLD